MAPVSIYGAGSVTTTPFVKFLMSLLNGWSAGRNCRCLRILAPLSQPNELRSCLACWAWESSVSTPLIEYAICQEVLVGVVVPDIHSEVCLCRSVVRRHHFLPCLDQIIDQRLHVNTHFIPWMLRNNQRHKYGMSLKENARGGFKGITNTGQHEYDVAIIP